MKSTILEDVAATYGVEHWGAGYFAINREGHLVVRPEQEASREADVFEIVRELIDKKKVATPLLLRFPQILSTQMRRLCLAYEAAAREYAYSGGHFPVFPMKVNPRREVVEEFLREGVKQSVGLECGSKAELYVRCRSNSPPNRCWFATVSRTNRLCGWRRWGCKRANKWSSSSRS